MDILHRKTDLALDSPKVLALIHLASQRKYLMLWINYRFDLFRNLCYDYDTEIVLMFKGKIVL